MSTTGVGPAETTNAPSAGPGRDPH